ncbi:MAG: phosphopentomutase [Gemmatimonadota bacterium]
MARRAAVIVLDGVGAGEAPDSRLYGDSGSNTLGNLARAVGGLRLPVLESLGLGAIAPIEGLSPNVAGGGARCILTPAAAGKDSTTGHWELCGVTIDHPFPTYPEGFPQGLMEEFARLTGRPVFGNVAASGTAIIEAAGREHLRTGAWIVYTSADSVFQIAAHELVVPLAELYAACRTARELLVAPHNVARVIARPFTGSEGSWQRTANRRDFSLEPPRSTLLDALAEAGIPRAGAGKVDDLFAGRSISSRHTSGNVDGIRVIESWLTDEAGGFLLANLVDFDQLFGHRNDIEGFHGSLRDFDAALGGLLSLLQEEDLLVITADHGNDPTTRSTDHSREVVPMLMVSGQGSGSAGSRRIRSVTLPPRPTFADLGATLGEWFGLEFRGDGTSFLQEVAGEGI